MKTLKRENLKFTDDREDMDAQWEISWNVFENFYHFLRKKGLKPGTISFKLNGTVLFIMNYIFRQTLTRSITDVRAADLEYYMEEEFPEIFPNSTSSQQKRFRKAVIDFFTFLKKEGFVSREHLAEIKTCR